MLIENFGDKLEITRDYLGITWDY